MMRNYTLNKMTKMNLYSWINLLISFVCICSGKKEVAMFVKTPGVVNCVEGRPLTLVWKHSVNKSEANDCYWEYDDFDPVLVPKYVLSYIATGYVRPGEHIVGWYALNEDNPCFGGIEKSHAEKSDAGYYKMVIGKLHSQKSTVYVYKLDDLVYNVSVGEKNYSFNAQSTHNELPAITFRKSGKHYLKIRINDEFPKTTSIFIKTRDTDGVLARHDCIFSSNCTMPFRVYQGNDISVVMTIDTTLHHFPDIRVRQTFHSRGTVSQATVIVGVTFGTIVVGLVCVVLWMKFREKGDETENCLISNGLAKAQCYSYYYNLIPNVREAIPDTDEGFYKKLVILTSASGEHVSPQEYDNITRETPMDIELSVNHKTKVEVYKLGGINQTQVKIVIDQPRNVETIQKAFDRKKWNKKGRMLKEIQCYLKCLDDTLKKDELCYDNYIIILLKDKNAKLDKLLAALNSDNIEKHSPYHEHITCESGLTAVPGLAFSYCYAFPSRLLPKLNMDEIRRNVGEDVYEKFIILIDAGGRFISIEENQGYIVKRKLDITVKIRGDHQENVDVYKVTDPDDDTKVLNVMFEQPRILSVLSKMLDKRDGFYSTEDKEAAIKLFTEQVKEILNRQPGCKNTFITLTHTGHSDTRLLATEIFQAIHPQTKDNERPGPEIPLLEIP